jgi:tRNA (guanine-N7-)-methyltransferase
MNKRYENNSSPTALVAGDTEYEMGIPIPGVILEKEQWVQTAIKRLPEEGTLELASIFGRAAPVALDIGCGNGRFSLSSAVRRPDWDHLAIDILPAVIRYGTRRGNQRGLSNMRFAVCDGWRFMADCLPSESLDEIHIYHPQPYADPTQASKRMMTPDFLMWMHRRLKPGGQVYLQSDRLPYWDYIRSIMSAVFTWQEIDQPWPEDPNGRSRREVLSNDQGLKIYRGIGIKRAELTDELLLQIIRELPIPKFQIEHSKPRNKRPYRRKR